MKVALSVLGLVALTGFAHASFELALLTTVGSNAITRVDPENRVVLGSFGANRLLNPRGIAARTTGSEAYILNSYDNGSSRVTVMNYFTGATIREFGVTAGISFGDIELLPNGDILVINNTSINRYTSTGGFVQTYIGPESILSVSYSENFNEVYAHTTGFLRYFNADTGLISGTLSRPAFRGANANQAFGVSIGGDGQNLRRLDHFTLNTTSVNFIGMNSINSIGYGHGNTVYAAGFGTAGQSTITTFDTNLNRLSDAWNIAGGGNGITGIAVVTAPEPGTMIALGAGLAVILRRKRNRKI